MQLIEQKYRDSYTGENMLITQTWSGGNWQMQHEYVPSRVENIQISNQACVIGNGYSREKFDLWLLANHRAGFRGNKALQLYGCNALYRDLTVPFLVATGDDICQELVDSGYCDNNVVYSTSQKIMQYPGKFYLVPQDPHWNAGAVAAYLACFDGHEKVYLLGFDNRAGDNLNNNIYAGTDGYGPVDLNISDLMWIKVMRYVMQLYPDVQFTRVMPTDSWEVPPEWKDLLNFRQISFNQFYLEVDL